MCGSSYILSKNRGGRWAIQMEIQMTEIYEFNYFNSQSSKFDRLKIYFSEMKKKF